MANGPHHEHHFEEGAELLGPTPVARPSEGRVKRLISGAFSRDQRPITVGFILLFVVAVIFIARTFINLEENQPVKLDANTINPQLSTPTTNRREPSRSLSQSEAAQLAEVKEQYNQETLEKIQEENPYALPVWVPEDNSDGNSNGYIERDAEKIEPVSIKEIAQNDQSESQAINLESETPVEPQGPKKLSESDKAILKNLLARTYSHNPIVVKSETVAASQKSQMGEVVAMNAEPVDLVEGVTIIKEMEHIAASANFALSTYYPSNVELTLISSDPLINGATVSGNMKEYTPPAKIAAPLIQVELTRLCLTDNRCTNITALAFDTETSRFAIASEVDSHWLQRYGFWGLGVLLQGAGIAVQLGNSETVVQDGVVVQDRILSTRDQVIVSVGVLGEQIGSVLAQRVNDPPEVKVNKYERLGVWFTKPVIIEL